MKIIKCIVMTFLTMLIITGCAKKENKEMNVVCSFFPEYDWVKEIALEDTKIKLLIDNGIDVHSYQPTVSDIISIKECDLFVYVGGESEKWADDVVKETKNIKTVKLMDVLVNELIEEDEEEENDEHVWLSLLNTKKIVKEIASALSDIDEENKETYEKNSEEYIKKIDELHQEYTEVLTNANTKTLLFADRFPFRYLTYDYNLEYYAAFPGCSTESDASFETIIFLTNKMEEFNLKNVIIIEGSSDKIAKAIIGDKDIKILTLDALQTTTLKQNKTYLSIMESNLETLKEATK